MLGYQKTKISRQQARESPDEREMDIPVYLCLPSYSKTLIAFSILMYVDLQTQSDANFNLMHGLKDFVQR